MMEEDGNGEPHFHAQRFKLQKRFTAVNKLVANMSKHLPVECSKIEIATTKKKHRRNVIKAGERKKSHSETIKSLE